MNDSFREAPRPYDPIDKVPVLELPEGTKTLGALSRFLKRDERAYDPLWRYVRKVDRRRYHGQTGQVRFGKHHLGLRSPNRIPAFVDFLGETLYLGRKLTIPFSAIRALMVGQGVLPHRKIPVFVLFVRVDGCDKYLPLHRCSLDQTVVDLADFLSTHMRVPMGFASRPLGILVKPGSPRMRHGHGKTPLYDLRGTITTRSPEGRTKMTLLAGADRITLVDRNDQQGWLENWSLIADDLLSILAKRARSRYGKSSYGKPAD